MTDPTSPAFDDAAWRSGHESARAEAKQWLTAAPTSYLAAILRVEFGASTSLVVGRAEDAQVRIDDPAIRPHHLRVTVEGDAFAVTALDAGATFSLKAGELRDAKVPPSGLRVGRFVVRLSHQGFPAIIVFDPQSPHFKDAPRPDWWPLDAKSRVLATLVKTEQPEEVVIQSTRGQPRRALRLGAFVFELAGQPLRLDANRLLEPGVGENAVSVFFRDATTGKGSYEVGRYIDPREQADGRWLLDFNSAYNPACAWSPHFNCPIPPRANTLKVAIEAGDRVPIGGH